MTWPTKYQNSNGPATNMSVTTVQLKDNKYLSDNLFFWSSAGFFMSRYRPLSACETGPLVAHSESLTVFIRAFNIQSSIIVHYLCLLHSRTGFKKSTSNYSSPSDRAIVLLY